MVYNSTVWLWVGLGEFPWRAWHPRKYACGRVLSMRWPDLYLTGPTAKCLLPWRDGVGRIESRDWPRLTLSVFLRPDESRALSDLTRERWAACEYPKGLGHHASGCDIELETPPRPTTDYLGEEMTTRVRSHRETAFIRTRQPLPREAETPPRTRQTQTWQQMTVTPTVTVNVKTLAYGLRLTTDWRLMALRLR